MTITLSSWLGTRKSIYSYVISWHIKGGKGQMQNTTIKRVLQTNPDGSQEVVMVENDMDRNVQAAYKGKGFSGFEAWEL